MVYADRVHRPTAHRIIQRLAAAQELLVLAERQLERETRGPAQRRVHVRQAVFRFQVIGVLGTGRAGVQKITRSARTRIVIARPGQRGKQRQSLAHALLRLGHQRIVARVAAIVELIVDRAERGIRQQQLHLADRRAANHARAPLAREGIGYRRRQRRPLREQRRIQRVDVDVRRRLRQVRGVRPHVTNFHRDSEGQFTLDVERVLLHPRRTRIRVDDRKVLSDARQVAQSAARRLCKAGRERIVDVVRGRRIAVVGRDVACGRRETGRIIRRTDGELRRPKQTVAAANRGLGIDLPGQADTWRELVQVGVADVDAVAVDARELDHALRQDPGHISRQRIHALGVEPNHHRVVLFLQAILAFPPHAHVHGQRFCQADVVLEIRAIVVGVFVELSRNVAGARGSRAQQHVRHIGARAGNGRQRCRSREHAVKREGAGAVGEIVAIVVNAAIVEAGLQIVLALILRDASREVRRVVHVVEVIIRPQTVLGGHRYVGKCG